MEPFTRCVYRIGGINDRYRFHPYRILSQQRPVKKKFPLESIIPARLVSRSKKKKNNNVYTYLSSRKFSFRENNLDSLVNPIGWISRRYRIAQFQVTGRCYCSSIENATHDCSRPSHSRIPINSSDIVFVVVFTRSEMEQRCAKVGTVVPK